MTEQVISQDKFIEPLLKDQSSYVRYHIQPHETEARKKLPHPFWPIISKFGLIKYLSFEALDFNVKLVHKKYRKVLLQRPCIYGVFGRITGGLTPVRSKCVGCMRCVQEVPNVCKVKRNPKFYNLGDSFWIPEDMKLVSSTPISLVNFEASTGKILVKGMGYKGTFGSRQWYSMWTDMSEIVRPTRDGVYGREYISMSVDLGKRQQFVDFSQHSLASTSVLTSSLPIIFDFLPENLTSRDIEASIASAALQTNTFFIIHYSQAKNLSEAQINHAILLIDDSKSLFYDELIKNAPLIELTSETLDIYKNVRNLRSNKPIAFRLKLSDNYKDTIAKIIALEFDILHIEADYHGMTYESNSTFIKDAIRDIHQFLVKEKLRDKISIIASGGIILAEHVPKAIICGSDVVAINTSILVALQCEFKGEIRFPEKSKIKKESFDSKWGEQRLANLLSSWHNQCIEILSAMGMRDIRRLRGDVGRAIFKEDIENEAFIDLEVV